MWNLQARRVQEHPFEAQTRKLQPQRIVAVLIVAHDGVARGCKVHPYLMRPTGAKFRTDQSVTTITLQPCDDRMRGFALGIHFHAPLAVRRQPLEQWLADV